MISITHQPPIITQCYLRLAFPQAESSKEWKIHLDLMVLPGHPSDFLAKHQNHWSVKPTFKCNTVY